MGKPERQQRKSGDEEMSLLDIYEKIEARTERRLAVLGGLIGLFMVGFGFLYFSSLSEIKSSMKTEVAEYQLELQKKAEADVGNLINEVRQAMTSARAEIDARIASELSVLNVEKMVRDGVESRVSSITDEVINARVFALLEPQIGSLERKLEKAKTEIDFAADVLALNRGDRKAFDRLLIVSRDLIDPRRSDAIWAIYAKISEPKWYAGDANARAAFSRMGIDPDKATVQNISGIYFDKAMPAERYAIAEWVHECSRFKIKDKMSFMRSVLEDDDFIEGMLAANEFINKNSGSRFNLIKYKYALAWIRRNQNRFSRPVSIWKSSRLRGVSEEEYFTGKDLICGIESRQEDSFWFVYLGRWKFFID